MIFPHTTFSISVFKVLLKDIFEAIEIDDEFLFDEIVDDYIKQKLQAEIYELLCVERCQQCSYGCSYECKCDCHTKKRIHHFIQCQGGCQ